MARTKKVILPYTIPTYECKNCKTPINYVRLSSQPNTKRGFYFLIDKTKLFCSKTCVEFYQRRDKDILN